MNLVRSVALEICNGVSEGVSSDDAIVYQYDVFAFEGALDRVELELDSDETLFLCWLESCTNVLSGPHEAELLRKAGLLTISVGNREGCLWNPDYDVGFDRSVLG